MLKVFSFQVSCENENARNQIELKINRMTIYKASQIKNFNLKRIEGTTIEESLVWKEGSLGRGRQDMKPEKNDIIRTKWCQD